jgi:D-alanyl-D-alanine carboxypeptidase (penicillin-binding protein 5/6)
MNRHSFFFIQLLAACFFITQLQAAPVPVLDSKAKRAVAAQKRQWKRKPAAAVRRSAAKSGKKSGVTVLGSRKSLAKVKEKAAPASSHAAVSDNISRRITSKSVMIIDARTGEPIFAKAPDNPRQPASTIKVLTGMIALKRLKENEKVKVSSHAATMPRSKVYLNPRKQYNADDLINAVLLASANDASVALAEKIAGSEKDFASLMTLHARLLGAENTVCRTASGLTAQGQHSTARDLAEIFRHAMQDREFAERMRQTKVRTSYGKLLRNHNKALWQMEGAVGGKTGYTSLARQTYVGQFKRGNDAIVVAIMGSETMWRDIQRLVDYGFEKKEQIRLAQVAGRNSDS